MTDQSRTSEQHWSHIKPRYLIRATKDYIIFIDDDIDIDWESSSEYDAANGGDVHQHNSILNDAALLEATPCDGLRTDMKLQFKRLIAEAMTRSFDHDYDSASAMLKTAGAYILARSQETSRFWYLSASFAMTSLFVVVGGVLWLSRAPVSQFIGSHAFWFIMSAIAGALGALLSVIGRTGKLEFDCSAGRALHYLEGASRIWAGALSGVIVGIAVSAEMILAPLSRGGREAAIMILAALAAGTGERLATSIISTIGAAQARAPHDDGRGGRG